MSIESAIAAVTQFPHWVSPCRTQLIVNADNRSVLPLLPDGCVDAVVTDPPYGIGWCRGTWEDDADTYPDFMRQCVQEFNRVASSGWCFVFQAMLNAPRFHEWFGANWRLFAACKNFAQIRPTGVWHSWDPVVFWKNGPNSGPNRGPNSGHVNRDYHVGNVAGCFGDRVDHPCPRPLDTVEHIVQLAATEGGVIIDSFAGSGTTAVATVLTRRACISVETDPGYYAVAVRRVQDALGMEVKGKSGVTQRRLWAPEVVDA